MKLFGMIGEALPEHAQLGPALHIGIVPTRWYRRGSCLVHGIFCFMTIILILVHLFSVCLMTNVLCY